MAQDIGQGQSTGWMKSSLKNGTGLDRSAGVDLFGLGWSHSQKGCPVAEINLLKITGSAFIPATEADAEAMAGVKIGTILRCKYTKMRNSAFFRKWWALVGLAYDQWEPAEIEIKDQRFTPEKNMETFRKNLTVMAGYYDTHFTIAGEPRIEARSISFASMSEDDFVQLYSKTVDVVLKHILKNYTDRELEDAVLRVMRFV